MQRLFKASALGSAFLFALSLGAQTPTTTSVTVTPSAGPYGQQFTATGSVAPSTAPFVNPSGAIVLPGGTMQFLDGTATLGDPVNLTPGSCWAARPFGKVFGVIDGVFANVTGQLTGDLNGDGVEDLLIFGDASTASFPQVNVEIQSFLSNGKGGYSATAAASLAVAPAQAFSTPVLGDINGDGKLDLLIGSSVSYGTGDGRFAQPVPLAFLGSGYAQTYLADVTGDGKIDIVALNAVPFDLENVPYTLQVTVFANQGSGNFQSLATLALGSAQVVAQAMLASLNFVDLNGDGKLDMVAQMYFVPAGNAAEPATLTSLLNQGDGTFAAPVPVTYAPQQNGGSIELLTLQVADFNKDGKQDLALVYPAAQSLGVLSNNPVLFLPGNGDGTFGPEIDSVLTTPGTGSGAVPAGNAVVTDANLDGAGDIAFGSGAVAAGDGAGHFSSGASVTGPTPLPAIGVIGTFPDPIAGAAYPLLVYVGTPATANAPLPLVAAHNFASTASPAALVLSAGTHSITASYSGDASYAASTSASGVVTVAAVTPAIVVTASANPSFDGQPVIYTISLAGTGPAPSGTITLQGSTPPAGTISDPQPAPAGTGTLDSTGKTAITVTFANFGGTVTFTYSGDGNYAPVATSIVQGVLPTFGINNDAGIATITAASGNSASAQINVSGVSGYTSAVTLGCIDLPATASCSFSPATLTIAGTTAQASTLTISTAGSSTTALALPLLGAPLTTLTCHIFAGSLLLLWPGRRRAFQKAGLLGLIFAALVLLPIGCGNSTHSSKPGNNTPPGTYPFHVTATSGLERLQYNYLLQVQ